MSATGHLVIGFGTYEDDRWRGAGCDAWRAQRAVADMVRRYRTDQAGSRFIDLMLDNGQRVRVRPK